MLCFLAKGDHQQSLGIIGERIPTRETGYVLEKYETLTVSAVEGLHGSAALLAWAPTDGGMPEHASYDGNHHECNLEGMFLHHGPSAIERRADG